MKPYTSAFHAYTNETRPLIGVVEPKQLDEVSDRTPPASQSPAEARAARILFGRTLGGLKRARSANLPQRPRAAIGGFDAAGSRATSNATR